MLGGSGVTSQQFRESLQLPPPSSESDDAVPGVAAVQEVPSIVSNILYYLYLTLQLIDIL